MRLAMSILVRDEADIIEANIRHHAKLGVSIFVVTDNSSVDGTREILEHLTKEFDLTIIDEPSLTIDQDLWVTRMANLLSDGNIADWVINNDADEFWLAENDGKLTDAIQIALENASYKADEIGVLYCERYNLIPSQEIVQGRGYQFSDNNYRVMQDWLNAKNELNLNDDSTALLDQNQHVIIRTLPGKVITRLYGLESIDMGNHGAIHKLNRVNTSDIEVAHYPIRNYEQFKCKVVNYGSSLKNNSRFGARTSLHLRRWFESYERNELQADYNAIVLPQKILAQLEHQGVLQATTTASRLRR